MDVQATTACRGRSCATARCEQVCRERGREQEQQLRERGTGEAGSMNVEFRVAAKRTTGRRKGGELFSALPGSSRARFDSAHPLRARGNGSPGRGVFLEARPHATGVRDRHEPGRTNCAQTRKLENLARWLSLRTSVSSSARASERARLMRMRRGRTASREALSRPLPEVDDLLIQYECARSARRPERNSGLAALRSLLPSRLLAPACLRRAPA